MCFRCMFSMVIIVLGSIQEINYKLSTYGIPNLPVNEDGSCSVEDHIVWLNHRKQKEESEFDGITIPQRFDVLFGRGKGVTGHTGNVRVGYLIEVHRNEYENADKMTKTRIASSIVRMVHESNGRFLKKEDGVWVEVSDEVAREKVSHFFRNLRGRGKTKSLGTKRKSKLCDEGPPTEPETTLSPTPTNVTKPYDGNQTDPLKRVKC